MLFRSGYLYNLGNALKQQGRFDDAIRYLQQALQISPSYAAAWKALGDVHNELQMSFKACECYREAYKLEPASENACVNYIRSLYNTGEFTEAAAISRRHLQTHPEDMEIIYMQAQCLIDAGDAAQALENMRAGLRTDPLSAPLQHAAGMLTAELGDFAAAKQHYAKALAIDPQYYEVYFSLAAIQTCSPDDPLIAELETRIQRSPPQTVAADVSLQFALGKMLEDQGEYERAFAHFTAGNKAMRGTMKYSTAAQTAYAESLLDNLDAGFIARQRAAGSDSDTPIFIVGMLRSGTSLVEQVLAGHSQVAAGGELMFLPHSLRKYTEAPSVVTGDKIAQLPDEVLREVGNRYLGKLSEFHPGARRVTDKLPGNFMMLGLIRTLFPKIGRAHV